MRRYFYTSMICVFIFSPAVSQFKYGASLNDSILIILNSRSKTLYVGIDNPIGIVLDESEKFEDYYLFTNNGTAFVDSLNFIVMPNRTGLARLVLMKTCGDDTSIIGQRFYNVKMVPEPQLQIDTLKFSTDAAISKYGLLSSDSISIFISSDIINSDYWFKINRFTVGYIYGGFYRNYLNQGNKFNYETRLLINKLGPGKVVIFKIFAEGEGNLIVELPVYRLELQ